MARLQKLVDTAQFAYNEYDARRSTAMMNQEGDDLVITFSFDVPDYDRVDDV